MIVFLAAIFSLAYACDALEVYGYGKVEENTLAATCADGCISNEELKILRVTDIDNVDTTKFAEIARIREVMGETLISAAASDNRFNATYMMVASASTFKLGKDTCTQYQDGYHTEGMGAPVGDMDHLNNDFSTTCFQETGSEQTLLYVPRVTVAQTSTDCAGVSTKDTMCLVQPSRVEDLSSRFTAMDGNAYGLGTPANGVDDTAAGICLRTDTSVENDCGGADQCISTSDAQFGSPCLPYSLSGNEWILNEPRGVVPPTVNNLGSRINSNGEPFVVHDCGSSENLISHIDNSGVLKCLYPTVPHNNAADNAIRYFKNGASEPTSTVQQHVMWHEPIYVKSGDAVNGYEVTVLRFTRLGHAALLFGRFDDTVTPANNDISWALPVTTASLAYQYNDNGPGYYHQGCHHWNANAWAGGKDAAGVCTYNFGMLLRSSYLAQRVMGPQTDTANNPQVLDAARSGESVSLYHLRVTFDPVTFEDAIVEANAVNSRTDVLVGDILCYHDSSVSYMAQEVRIMSDTPGVVRVLSVAFENMQTGTTVVMISENAACQALGNVLRDGISAVTDDACISGTVKVGGSHTNHVAPVLVALDKSSGCRTDRFDGTAKACYGDGQNPGTGAWELFTDDIHEGNVIRVTVKGVFYSVNGGGLGDVATDIDSVTYVSDGNTMTPNWSSGAPPPPPTLLGQAFAFEAVAESQAGLTNPGSYITDQDSYDPATVAQSFDTAVCDLASTDITIATISGGVSVVSHGVSTVYGMTAQGALSVTDPIQSLYNMACTKTDGLTTCGAMQSDQLVATNEYQISMLNYIKDTGTENVFTPSAATPVRPMGGGTGAALFSTFFGPQNQPQTALSAQEDHLTVPIAAWLEYECDDATDSSTSTTTIHLFGGVDPVTKAWNVNSADFLDYAMGIPGASASSGSKGDMGQRLDVLRDVINLKYEDTTFNFNFHEVAAANVKVGKQNLEGGDDVAISTSRIADGLAGLACNPDSKTNAEFHTAMQRFTAPPDEAGDSAGGRCDTMDTSAGPSPSPPEGGARRRMQTSTGNWHAAACENSVAHDQRGMVMVDPSYILNHGHNCDTGPAMTLIFNDQYSTLFDNTGTTANTYGASAFGPEGPCDADNTKCATRDLTAGRGQGRVFNPYTIVSAAPTLGTASDAAWAQWKATLALGDLSDPSSMSYVGLLLNTAYMDQCARANVASPPATKWTFKTQFLHTTARYGELARRRLEDLNVSFSTVSSEAVVNTTPTRRLEETGRDIAGAPIGENFTTSIATAESFGVSCADYSADSFGDGLRTACACTPTSETFMCKILASNSTEPPPPPPTPIASTSSDSWAWVVGIVILLLLVYVLRELQEEKQEVRAMHETMRKYHSA